MAEPQQTWGGALTVYPGKEMRAVDMAEALKALTMFEGVRRVNNTNIPVNGGILQGCTFAIPVAQTTTLRMSPGRIMIGGRVADFTPPENGNYFYFKAPSVSGTTTCVIVAVCDLANPSNPFYISVVTGTSSLDEASKRTTDEMFNRNNGLRYLRLGTVKVGSNGVFSDLTMNPNSSPVKTNKAYLDEVKSALDSTITANDSYAREWIAYFKKSHFNSDFFTAYRAIGDGLVIKANSSTTFKFRSEYGSEVHIQDSSGVIPGTVGPYVFIKPDGTIIDEGANSTPHPTPGTGPNGAPTDIVKDPYLWKFLGINEIHIENAKTSGTGAANCVIQSYYSEAATGGGHVCVTIRNLGSTAAKIKLTIRSLYVADIDG